MTESNRIILPRVFAYKPSELWSMFREELGTSERERLTLKGDSSPVLLANLLKFGSRGDPALVLPYGSGGTRRTEGSNQFPLQKVVLPASVFGVLMS